MKKMILSGDKASSRKTFKVYFVDGNQKLLEAEDIVAALNYVVYVAGSFASDIYKIEEVNY